MEGYSCKIFIVQFTFIGISYTIILFSLKFLHFLALFLYIENDLFSRFQYSYKKTSFPKVKFRYIFFINCKSRQEIPFQLFVLIYSLFSF